MATALTPGPRPSCLDTGPIEPRRLSGDEIASVSKALGHPARLKIVQHLKKIDQCICGQIVETLPLAQSTVSQHLKTLRAAGIVRGEVEGPRTCYCLDQERLEYFKRMAAAL